jgi:hypothetical protein
MSRCPIHTRFFDDLCPECRKEYNELKGLEKKDLMTQTNASGEYGLDIECRDGIKNRNYKEFSEERAKKLYAELLVQYLKKKSCKEEEAAERARAIIRKQCRLRGMTSWSWTG